MLHKYILVAQHGGLNIFCPICGADHSGEDDSSPEEAGIDTKHMQGFGMKLE